MELADALEQMWQKQRYHELFFMVDTCQSQSMFQLFYSPNILAVGSSHVGEDSLSHHVDPAIGVYIIDRYTYYALEFLESVQPDSQHTMGQFLKVCSTHHSVLSLTLTADCWLLAHCHRANVILLYHKSLIFVVRSCSVMSTL